MAERHESAGPPRSPLWFLIKYVWPFFLAYACSQGLNFERRLAAIEIVQDYVEQSNPFGMSEAACIRADRASEAVSAVPAASRTPTVAGRLHVGEDLRTFLNLEFARLGCGKYIERYSEARVHKTVIYFWALQGAYIFALLAIPAFSLAVPLSRLPTRHEYVRRGEFLVKIALGFIVCHGWLYFFNPYGQGASAVDAVLIHWDLAGRNTSPVFINYPHQLSPTMAAFVGWYLHMIGYLFFRSYRNDVRSSRIYSILFTKFLFVYGLTLIASKIVPEATGDAVASSESGAQAYLALTGFLLGYFPLSWVAVVKQWVRGSTVLQGWVHRRSNAKAENDQGQGGTDDPWSALAAKEQQFESLPGISRFEALRLQEQIDGISDLASRRVDELQKELGESVVSNSVLGLWIDVARLMTVLGPDYARQAKDTRIMTASYMCELAVVDPNDQRRVGGVALSELRRMLLRFGDLGLPPEDRGELTDAQWKSVRSKLEGEHADERLRELGARDPIVRANLDGVLWRLRTRKTWAEMPAHFPPYETCKADYERWSAAEDGRLAMILRALSHDLQQRGGVDLSALHGPGMDRDHTLEAFSGIAPVVESLSKSWQTTTALTLMTRDAIDAIASDSHSDK